MLVVDKVTLKSQMDEHTEQRRVGGLAVSRRGSSLSCRDRSHEDRSIRCCNRSGCSTRLSSMKGTNTIKQEQAKSSKPPSLLSSSKTMVGSSSKSSTGMSNLRKHHQEQQNSDLLKATSITVRKRRQQEVEADQSRLSTTGIQTGQTAPENAKTVAFHSLSMNSTKEVCNARPQKPIQQSGFGTRGRGTSMGSSIWQSFSSKNLNQSPKDQGTSAHRYGFKNLVCASMSGIHAPSSMSDSGRSRKSNAIRQRCPPDGESSSARGKKPGELSETSSQRNDFSGPSLPSTLHLMSQPSSRRMRNQSVSSSVPSVRTRRMISLDTDTRQSNSNNVDVTPESEMIPQLDQAELSINEFASGSSYQSFSTERPSAFLNSLRWPGSSEETARPRRSRPATRPENSSARPFHSFSLGHDGFRRLSMEIAEVMSTGAAVNCDLVSNDCIMLINMVENRILQSRSLQKIYTMQHHVADRWTSFFLATQDKKPTYRPPI